MFPGRFSLLACLISQRRWELRLRGSQGSPGVTAEPECGRSRGREDDAVAWLSILAPSLKLKGNSRFISEMNERQIFRLPTTLLILNIILFLHLRGRAVGPVELIPLILYSAGWISIRIFGVGTFLSL